MATPEVVHHIGPWTVTVTTDQAHYTVAAADLQALRTTVAELRALLQALGTPDGTPQVLRSAQGLARSVAQRLGGL